jgi:hypothetical protein
VLMLCRRLASTSVGVSIVNMVRRKPGMVFAHLLRAILNPTLADNGGPTRTHALVAGSPAIDTVFDGTCPPPARDPRGMARPSDGNRDGGPACDVGALER